MWEIKGKDNQTKATVYALEYNGEWMGESYVSVTIESPAPIAFAIGDYLMYRGERFEINYDPGKIKSAPPEAKGDAFKYENIKFNSLADELTRCDFLDVVLEDNQLHFTGLPKFSFYGGVQDLANRIQANLDRAYPNQWTVVVSSEYSGTKELNVSVDTQKVWDALSILVNDFETYFTIKGRTITIGASGVPAGHLFKYGKGNGLYEIEQNAEADQAIVTRLRAYGSTRNLPHRYYNSLTGADGQKLIPDNMAVQNLMLPAFPYTTQDPYIDSANKAALGIREGTIFFDGSQEGLEEIYPSIEGMTAEQLKAAGVPCNSTGALDVIVSAEQMTDDGVGDINEGETETTATPPTFKVSLPDLGFDINDHLTTETATISFKTGMLGGREFEIVGCEAIKDSADKVTGYELELNRAYDDGIKLWFPYKDYNAKAGDKIKILHIAMPEVYIKAAAQRLLEAATAWLAKNDYSRSVYAPKVDEIFMALQHDEAMASGGSIVSLHDTLKEGMMLLFEDDDLNIDASIFIDQLIIKEGDGPIPTYEITLKEEKTVGRLDKMQNQIDSLAAGQGQGSGGYNASQIRSLIDAYGGTRFLSRIKDDRTAHKLASDKAFEVGEFLAGVSGGFFGIDEHGDSYLEVARLYARVRAVFEELTVIKTGVLAGKQYITPGGGIVCTKVEEVTNASGTLTGWRCYFLSEQDGEKTECKFVANDQAISALFNAAPGTANKVSNHRYWRLVTAVDNDAYTDDSGNHYGYIELSATDCEAGSDNPQAGDEICQFGYRGTDEPRRQTAMVFSTVDADAPSIKLFRGINSYTLEGKAVVQFGVDAQSGKVFFRLGASNATHFLDYTEAGGLQVAGKISTLSTLDDTNTTLGTAINSKVEDTDVLWRLHTSQTDAPALPVLGADGTITDFKGWQTDAPAVVPGQFVWTTTYVRYGNGTAKFDGTACVTGRDGEDGKDAVSMTSEKVEYAIGTSGTVAPTSGWSTTIPAVPKGKYQWTRVITTYSDGTSTVSYSVAYIPKDGEDGVAGSNYTPNMLVGSRDWSGATPKGATNAGTISADKYNGFSVLEATGWWFGRYWIIDVEAGKDYTISCIALGAPDNFNLMLNPSWGSSMFTSTFTQTKYEKRFSTSQWGVAVRQIHCTKSGTLLVDFETSDKSLLVKWCAPKVEEGLNDAPVWSPAPSEQLGVTIASESVTYAKNTTGIQPPDASFTATAIGQLGTISGGDYIWSKTEVTYTDGTVLKSYAVSRIGSDGETQIAGLHLAYATGITGSLPKPTAVTGFSTTMVAGVTYKYIGIRKDNLTADSTNFADYDWAEFRGSDGQNGASYSNNMLVGTKDWSGDWVYLSNGTVTTDTYMGCVIFRTSARWGQTGQNIELQPGTYTFSVWVKSAVAGMNLNVYLTEAHWKRVQGTTEWQRVSLTFTLTAAGTYRPRLEKQDAGNDVFYMAGYKLEEGDNRAPTWSPHPSEMVATPAKLVIVNAPQLVFTYENNFATIVGVQQIVLQSTLQGTTGRQWSYRPGSASGFTDYPNATGETFTVPHNNSTYFPNGAKSCTFRCTSGDVYDEVTIYKVSSGSKGEDGANYTENLVADSGTAITTAGYLIKDFHTTEDLVEGEKYTLSIWGELAAGKVFNVYDNKGSMFACQPKLKADGLYTTQFTWKKSANATNASFHVYNFPSSVSGTSTINKIKLEHDYNDNPVWTPAPADGDGITVILTNESHVFEGDTEKAVTGSTECGVIAYKGATQVAATIGPITGAPSDMSVAIASNGTTSAKFTVAVTPGMAAKPGTLTIPVTVDGKSFTKKFSWSVSLEGQPGADYSENLLADAEFRGMAATEKVARWYKYSNVSVDNTHMMEGRNSMKSAQSGLTAAGWRGISQNYSKDVKSGDVFTCSIWVYCEDTSVFDSTNTMRMEMIGSNSSGNRTCTFPVSIIPSENNKWQQFHVSGTMPAGTIQVQLYAWVRQNGTAWFSSPKLERGSNPSPVWTPNPTDRIPVLSEEYYQSSSATELKGGSWSANKQPFAANTYYWTRIKKLYGDGTIEYTTPICATGTPGKDALRLDLTNEMAGVACNASGTPVSGALASVTSTAEVYKGGAKDSGWKFKKSDSGCSSNINESSGAITLNSISSDTATVTVTATKDGYDDLTATMSIHKVKPGADGQPATVYQIEPSANVIKRDMAGTPHPDKLVVTKYRTTGAAARQTTKEHFLYAWQTDANGIYVMSPVVVAGTTAETATIQIAPTAVEVGLELRVATANGAPVLDRETVPVITDVSDMEVATRNLLLNSGDWNLPDGAFTGNPLQGDWWWDDLSMAGSGGHLKMTCNATSGNRAAYERLSIRKAAEGTTMTLRVKGKVGGRTSGHIFFQLVCNWSTWQTVGQVAVDGEFDLIKTFDLSDEWNGDTVLIYGFSNANSGISLELEHAGLYIGNVIPTQWTAAPEDGSYLLKAIQRARQDSTEIDGGLILATLLQLGVTDVSGVRKIMSGISGICNSPADPAIWMGGDMINRLTDPTNSQAASGMFFHNGTGYLCNGVVQIVNDGLEIIDPANLISNDHTKVRLDKDGLHLLDSTGREALRVANVPVGGSFDAGTNRTYSNSAAATLAYNANSSIKLAPSGSGWNRTMALNSNLPITADNATATLTLDISFVASSGWNLPSGTSPYFEWTIKVNYTSGLAEEFTYSGFGKPIGNGTNKYSYSFTFKPAKGRTIRSVQIVNEAASMVSGTSLSATVTISGSVTVTYGYPNCTLIGNNGFQAVQNGAKLLCYKPTSSNDGEIEMSFTGIAGTFGLKVTSSGFKYRNVNMSSWADWNPGT